MKYTIMLEITTNLNPNKWNWHELLDLSGDEEDEEVLNGVWVQAI